MTISYQSSVVMRRFETIQIFASAKVELTPSDHVEKVFRTTYKQLEDEVEKQIEKKKILREKNDEEEREKDPA